MRCLAPAEIDRYISGVMDEVVAGGVTQHLASCRRCREAVARARASTAETFLGGGEEREGSQVTHLPVRCQRCGAQYAIPEERARGRRLTVRCMSCGGQMAVEGDDSGLSSPSLASISVASGDTGERCWFLIEDRQRMGPYAELDLLRRLDKGLIDGETHVWRDGYKEWRKLSSLPQFKAVLADPQPVPRSSTDPFPPPPDAVPPGYDPGRVANSMLDRETATEEPGLDPEGWRGSTDQLPMISSVAPAPVDESQSTLRTAIIDPVEEQSESGVKTVMRPPPGQSESGVKTVLLEGEEGQEALRAGMPTRDDGETTRPRPRVERTEQIHESEISCESPISDDARTRLHYQQKDPREGLLDEEEGAADELAPIFDGGGLESTMEAPPVRERTAQIVMPAPQPTKLTEDDALQAGAWDRRMQGERHDNSVLFSLQHLKKLAGPDGSIPGFPREESGLVDIQAMPVDAPAPAPAPLIISTSEDGSNKVAMFFTVGMLGALLGAFALLGLLHLARPELFSALLNPAAAERGSRDPAPAEILASTNKPNTPAPTPTSAPAPAAKQAQIDAGTPDAATSADSAPTQPEQPAAAVQPSLPIAPAALARPAPRPPRVATAPRPSATMPPEDPPVAVAADPAPRPAPAATPSRTAAMDPFAGTEKAPAKPKPQKQSSDQELDDLIDAATRGDLPPPRKRKAAPARPKPRPRAAPAPAPAPRKRSSLPELLTRSQVAAGMKRSNPAVTRCRTKHDRVGLVTVSVTISGATGRIGKGKALGPLGSSPVGACVLRAVKASATFPQFSGPAMTIKYPFILR